MHAVVVRVTIGSGDEGAAARELQEKVVPGVSQAPGFVAGYWTRKDNTGLSMIICESEDAANAISEQIPHRIAETVSIESVEVREVVASA